MYWGDHLFIEFLCSDNRSLKARRIKISGDYVDAYLSLVCVALVFRALSSTAGKTLANENKLSLGWPHIRNKHNVMNASERDKEICRGSWMTGQD